MSFGKIFTTSRQDFRLYGCRPVCRSERFSPPLGKIFALALCVPASVSFGNISTNSRKDLSALVSVRWPRWPLCHSERFLPPLGKIFYLTISIVVSFPEEQCACVMNARYRRRTIRRRRRTIRRRKIRFRLYFSGGSNASSFKLAVAATPAVLSSGITTEAPAEKRSQGATTVVSACNNI